MTTPVKSFPTPWAFLLAGILFLGNVLGNDGAFAQSRGGLGGSQQNRQSDLNTSSQATGSAAGRSSQFGQSGQNLQGSSSGLGQNNQSQGRQGQNSSQQSATRQDNFVGSDAQQVRAQQNNRNPGQRRRAMFDFAVESLNEMRESRRQHRANRNQKPAVHVQLRPLFTVPQPSASELNTQVRTQFDRALPSVAAATHISINNGTATLVGTTGNEYDKQLAAKMLSLQPGITQVENRLTIVSGQAETLPIPAR